MSLFTSINEKLKGFRTILLSAATWLGLYLDTILSNLSTTPDLSLLGQKGAAIMGAVIFVKQLITDVIPRLRGQLKK